MNCPSRTDELEWTPGYNQNPPFLAADLTTCEDLNGTVNARQLKRGSRTGCHPSDKSLEDEYQVGHSEANSRTSIPTLGGWPSWLLSVFCTSLLLSNVHILNPSNMRLLLGAFWKSSKGKYILDFAIDPRWNPWLTASAFKQISQADS
jgi:hypothetical protein